MYDLRVQVWCCLWVMCCGDLFQHLCVQAHTCSVESDNL